MGSSTTAERLVRGPTGRLFIAVSAGWLLIQLGRQVIPPMLPRITADLAITPAQAGVALSVMWGLYALLQYPSGRLSDRLGRKTLLVGGLGLLTVGMLAIAGTVSYPMFVAGVAVVGIGAGLYPTAARALVSDLFVERRGQAFGIHTASGDLGNALAAGVALAAMTMATWRAAFLPVAACFVLLLVVIHLWSQEDYDLSQVDLAVWGTATRLLGTPRFRGILAAYVLFAFTWQSVTGFLPTFLQVEKGQSEALASAGFALLFGIGMLAKPAAGWLGDRLGRAQVGAGALLVALVGLVIVLLTAELGPLFLGIAVFAGGLMAFPPVLQAFLMDRFPTESMGGDLGGMRTVYVGLGSLGPTYVGAVASVHSYTVAFLGLLPCLLVSATLIGLHALWDGQH